jgi:DNA-binding transcriptional ArsR family regulator
MPNQSQVREFKAEFFKALAHPIRIHILDALRDGEQNVNELRDILGIEGPNVSQQLAILRGKNLVNTRKEGNSVYYSVRDPLIFQLLDVSKAIFNNHLIDLQAVLEEIQT